jgi:Tfp pilus assembly protein PilP
MKYSLLVLVLILGGCNAVQNAEEGITNPVTGVSKAATTKVKEEILEEPVGASRLELIKRLFLMRRDLGERVLQMASGLTDEQFDDLNEWMSHYGVQLKKRLVSTPRESYDPQRTY